MTRTTSWLAGPWSMKAIYLSFYMAAGIYFPFLGLYYQAVHLDGVEIGVLASAPPLAGVVLQPLWGLLSDRLRWRKQVLVVSLLAAAVIAPAVALAHSFVTLLPLVIVLAVALSPVTPLSDATTLESLRRHGGSFGAVRVYGSFGFLVTSLAIGQVYAGSRILWLFPIYGALLFVTFLCSLSAPRQQDTVQLAGGSGVAAVLRDRTLLLFLALAFVGYATYAAYNTFYALYLKSLGAGTGVVGLSSGLAALGELPVMALAGRAMARVGVKPLLLVGLSAACLRWIAYGFVHDYRLAVAVSSLHGLSFAAFYAAGVTYIDTRAPEGARATAQTLFNGATFGLGTIVGANLFGSLYDRLHSNGMFLVAGAICAVAIAGIAAVVPNVPFQIAVAPHVGEGDEKPAASVQ